MGERPEEATGDRFGAVLGLTLAAVTTAAFSKSSVIGSSVALALLASALLWTYRVAHVGRRLQVMAGVLVLLALGTVATAIVSGTKSLGFTLQAVIGLLLATSAPAVIGRRLATHRRITLQTVAGALTIYLLIGLFISYLLLSGDRLLDDPILSGNVTDPLTLSDAVYFGFITLTTIGYGDITPAGGFSRAVAMAGGLIGQLYLVSAVALVVGNLGQVRQGTRGG